MKSFIRLFICGCLLLGIPLNLRAQTRSIISNLANPAIGMSALFLGQAAPNLTSPGSTGPSFQEAEISVISTVDPLWTLAGISPSTRKRAWRRKPTPRPTASRISKSRSGSSGRPSGSTERFTPTPSPSSRRRSSCPTPSGEEGFKNAGIEAAG